MQAAPLPHSGITVQDPGEKGHDVFLGGLHKEAKSVFSKKFTVSRCHVSYISCLLAQMLDVLPRPLIHHPPDVFLC